MERKSKRAPFSGLPLLAATIVLFVVYLKQQHVGNPWIALYATGLLLPAVCGFDRILTLHFSVFSIISALLFATLGYIATSTSGSMQMWLSIPTFYLLALAIATQQTKASQEKPMTVWISLLLVQGLILMIIGNIQVFAYNGFVLSWSTAFYISAALSLACALEPLLNPSPSLPQGEGERLQPHPIPPPRGEGSSWISSPSGRLGGGLSLLTSLIIGQLLIMPTLFLIDMPHNGGLGLSPQEYAFAMGAIGVAGLAIGFHHPRPLSSVLMVFKGRRLHATILAAVVSLSVYIALSRWLPKNFLLISLLILISQTGVGYLCSAYRYRHMGKCDKAVFLLSFLLSGQLQFELGYRHYFLFWLAAILVVSSILLIIAYRQKA